MSLSRFIFLKEWILRRPLGTAIVAGVAAALFATGYLSRKEALLLHQVEPVPVVWASQEIAAGEALDESALSLASVPRRFQEPGAISSIGEAAGRIAQVPLRAGSQITSSVARLASSRRGLSGLIPAGLRAITVALPAADAALVRPQDTVDLFATFDLGNEASVRRTTLTLIPRALVLAVQGVFATFAENREEHKKTSGLFGSLPTGPAGEQWTVTLAASPEQAQAVAFAQQSGALALAVRPIDEEEGLEAPKPTTITTITRGNEELLPMKRSYREYRGKR